MTDPSPFVVSAFCALTALASLPLLLAPVRPAERRLWRRLRIQALRRWLTRNRGSRVERNQDRVVATARRNILWHVVLTATMALIALHPAVVALQWRAVVYGFLVAGSLAYLAGSIVQRQKIAVVTGRIAKSGHQVQ